MIKQSEFENKIEPTGNGEVKREVVVITGASAGVELGTAQAFAVVERPSA